MCKAQGHHVEKGDFHIRTNKLRFTYGASTYFPKWVNVKEKAGWLTPKSSCFIPFRWGKITVDNVK